MLALPKKTIVKLNKANTHMERHGESLVPCVTLSLTYKTGNKILDQIDPDLRSLLYSPTKKPDEAPRPQGGLDLPVDDMPNLRFPRLAYPLKFEVSWTGYTMVVDYGRGAEADLKIRMGQIKKVDVTPIDGGSVELDFSVQSNADIDEMLAGKLDMLQQSDITVKLTPPRVDGNVAGQATIEDQIERQKAAEAQANAALEKAKSAAKSAKGNGDEAPAATSKAKTKKEPPDPTKKFLEVHGTPEGDTAKAGDQTQAGGIENTSEELTKAALAKAAGGEKEAGAPAAAPAAKKSPLKSGKRKAPLAKKVARVARKATKKASK